MPLHHNRTARPCLLLIPANNGIFVSLFQILSKRNPIRIFCAGFMLLLFLFGITPKQFIHDILVDHHHEPITHDDLVQVSQSATFLYCDIFDQAIESPFLSQELPALELDQPEHSVFIELSPRSLATASSRQQCLRGPPAGC